MCVCGVCLCVCVCGGGGIQMLPCTCRVQRTKEICLVGYTEQDRTNLGVGKGVPHRCMHVFIYLFISVCVCYDLFHSVFYQNPCIVLILSKAFHA